MSIEDPFDFSREGFEQTRYREDLAEHFIGQEKEGLELGNRKKKMKPQD